MATVGKEDPTQIEAAQILVTLRNRELRRWPEWVPVQSGEASSSAGGTAATEVKRSSAGTEAARAVKRPREVFSAKTVAAVVPVKWPQRKISGSRGETSSPEQQQGHAAAAVAAAKGSGAPLASEQERCAEMPAASAQLQPVVAPLCYAVVGGPSVFGLSTSAAPATKEPMKTPSPNTPLDYGTGGSGAPASADGAAPARPQAKRKAGTGGDDEGRGSPAKRGPVAEEKKPMTISAQPSVQSETRASSSKREPFPFDLNIPLDEDDGGCPDAT